MAILSIAGAWRAQAVVGTLPKVFAKTHPVYGTPYVAIISNSIAMACVLFMPFGELAEVRALLFAPSVICVWRTEIMSVHLMFEHKAPRRRHAVTRYEN